ncbi:hypothetical protein Dimus_014949 [Dionaea muscipula]
MFILLSTGVEWNHPDPVHDYEARTSQASTRWTEHHSGALLLYSPLHGQILHAHLIKLGFHQDTYTATSLTTMYMKFHHTYDAVKLFDEMPSPNVASVTTTISSTVHCWAIKLGVERDVFVGTAMVTMYMVSQTSLSMDENSMEEEVLLNPDSIAYEERNCPNMLYLFSKFEHISG